MDKTYLMNRCLELASKANGLTSPNPMVGALLYKDGVILAEGYHEKAGSPHAEAVVLNKTGNQAHSATLFVNLEPCCHKPKRTPPCTDAIIASKVKEVFIAMKDPNPQVSGKGIKILEEAGIKVYHGIEEAKAKTLNEIYIKYVTTKKPFVILKVAMTLDGKIATPTGQSKWITSDESRKMVHGVRGSVDAILSAIGTVKTDNPMLTCRVDGMKNPLRIIIDPDFETPKDYHVFNMPPKTIFVTKNRQATADGVDFIFYDGTLSLPWLMEELGKRQVTSILIEGGSSLTGHVVAEGVVDKAMFFVAPKIIGGADSFVPVGGKSFRPIEDAFNVYDFNATKVGPDLLLEGYLKR